MDCSRFPSGICHKCLIVSVKNKLPATNTLCKSTLYVDDIRISCASCNLSICRRHLKLSINRMVRWADQNTFHFSMEKIVVVFFSRRRGSHRDSSLQLSGVPLPLKTEYISFCILLDQKLTFMPHLKHIKFPRVLGYPF